MEHSASRTQVWPTAPIHRHILELFVEVGGPMQKLMIFLRWVSNNSAIHVAVLSPNPYM